jgi:hypothetical protein
MIFPKIVSAMKTSLSTETGQPDGSPGVRKMRARSGFDVNFSCKVAMEHVRSPHVYPVEFFASTDVLQALSRFFAPFRLMKDVSCGTFEERMAAYRYNRSMRAELPACMLRWAFSCSIAILLTALFDTLGGGASVPGTPGIFVLLAAACATFIAFGVCVLFITAYVYFFLAHQDL